MAGRRTDSDVREAVGCEMIDIYTASELHYLRSHISASLEREVDAVVQGIPKCESCGTWPEPSVVTNGGLCNDCKGKQ
jgi:predicted Zn-ribbon and HTH transcriptional regulator